MKYRVILIWFSLKHVCCHLKDLGESKVNWTVVIDGLEKKIVGGNPTTLKQYPYNVQLVNFGGLCGGTILTAKTVMTAAHCFDLNTDVAEMRILSNSRYLFDHNGVAHKVWDFILHERYNDTIMFSNDIAIVIIMDMIRFGDTAQKAILTNSDEWMSETEDMFAATGWGTSKHGKNTGSSLMEVHLKFVSPQRCAEQNSVKLSPDMFCLHGDGVRDTCQGDSGGGILWKDTIVGIVSHGKSCAVTPSMYANVFYFRPWIDRTVATLYYKFCTFHHNKKEDFRI